MDKTIEKKEEKILKTVQEEWMGSSDKKEKDERVLVVKETSCSFD